MNGLRDFNPGQPNGENQSVLASGNAYGVVFSDESKPFKNAQAKVLAGSDVYQYYLQLWDSKNHGEGNTFTVIDNSSNVNGRGKVHREYQLLAVIKAMYSNGEMSIIGNTEQPLYVVELDLYLLSEFVQ